MTEKTPSVLSRQPRTKADIDRLGIALFGAEKWEKRRAEFDRVAAKLKARTENKESAK